MLRHLQISNYAIIQDLDVDFDAGLTVITGETGAGKSILLGALGLVLGNRADSKVLFDQSRKCVVEGRFDLSAYALEEFFGNNDLDYEPETVIRREILASGKSRAFINDTPVKLTLLESLASRLVNIHSQHETLDLNRSRFQTGVLDSLAANDQRLATYRQTFERFKALRTEHQERLTAREKALAERDYLQFQFDELYGAKLDGVDEKTLENELSALAHAGETKRALSEVAEWLQGEQGSVSGAVRQAGASLRPLLRWRQDLQPLVERLDSLRIEAADLAAEAEQAEQQTNWDPQRIDELQERLDEVNRLLHKHRQSRVEDLIALRDQFDSRLQQQDQESHALDLLAKEVAEASATVLQQATELSARRTKAAPGFEKSVARLLGEVGMPDARLKVEITTASEPGPAGLDQIQFLFASNKGSRFDELRQVASGGELSRLMLCIKSLVASHKALPTLIFDEIDTGVSGETGRRIGVIMEDLAQGHQVIAITHLPQIAACGQRHLFVYKDNKGKQTITRLRALEGEERVEGIARMISGDSVSEAARANARELLTQD